jgi:hypothetical protein
MSKTPQRAFGFQFLLGDRTRFPRESLYLIVTDATIRFARGVAVERGPIVFRPLDRAANSLDQRNGQGAWHQPRRIARRSVPGTLRCLAPTSG